MSAYGKTGKALGSFFKQGGERAAKARGKFKAGGYKMDQLAADVIGTWFDGMQAWTEGLGGSSTPPVCFITGNTGSPSNVLSLNDSIKTLPTSPDLLGIKADGSGTDIIKQAKVTLAFVDTDAADEILVTVNITAATKGTYQGFVVDGTALLGTIVVQVT